MLSIYTTAENYKKKKNILQYFIFLQVEILAQIVLCAQIFYYTNVLMSMNSKRLNTNTMESEFFIK